MGARERLNGRKKMARRKVKNGEKSPWGQCLTRPVPNGRRRSGFWLVPENCCVFLPNQKPADLWVVSCILTRNDTWMVVARHVCLGRSRVVPKSYRSKEQPRSTRNEFPIRVDFGNSRKHPIWRLKRGENWQPKEPFYRQRSVIYGIVDAVCVYCEFWSVLGPV